MDGILSVDGFDKSLAEGLMLLTPFSVDEESSQDFVTAYRDAYGSTRFSSQQMLTTGICN